MLKIINILRIMNRKLATSYNRNTIVFNLVDGFLLHPNHTSLGSNKTNQNLRLLFLYCCYCFGKIPFDSYAYKL